MRYLFREHLNSVVINQPQVGDAGVLGPEHAMTNPRFVNLDAQEVLVWCCGGLLDECLAVAETDLEYDGCRAPEQGREIQWFRSVFQAITRPKRLKGALLRRRNTPGSADEAADCAFVWSDLIHSGRGENDR